MASVSLLGSIVIVAGIILALPILIGRKDSAESCV